MTKPNNPKRHHPSLTSAPPFGYVALDEFDRQFAEIIAQITCCAKGPLKQMMKPSVWNAE